MDAKFVLKIFTVLFDMHWKKQCNIVMLNLFDKGNVRTEGDDCDPVLTRRSRSAASVQTCIVAKIWIVSENFFKPKFPTCIVSLSFLTFIFSFCVLQAKREGAEAGGLRAGGSRNAVYGDRVRQKKTNQNTLKSILIRTARIRAYASSKKNRRYQKSF